MAIPAALVIEDDFVFADALADLLRSVGFVAQTASTTEEATALLLRERFDVVVLDMLGPWLDGWQVIDLFDELALASQLIVVSGQRMPRPERAAAFLAKPVRPEDVLAWARRLTPAEPAARTG